MCNPVAATIGISAVSGVYAASSQRQIGAAQQNYYNYLASSANVQALEVERTGQQQVGLIQDAAARDASSLSRSAKGLEGRQKTVQAASGVPLSSVTSEDISRDTMTKEDLDQAALKFNADTRAWETLSSSKATGRGLREQATQFRYAGSNARTAANIQANTSLLGAATNIADSWYKWRSTSTGDSPSKKPYTYDYSRVSTNKKPYSYDYSRAYRDAG